MSNALVCYGKTTMTRDDVLIIDITRKVFNVADY
jgi:hypothetical protein